MSNLPHSHTQTNIFKPAWWLNNRHLQTLYPTLFRSKLQLKRVRERFTTPDKDFLDCDWYTKNSDKTKPLVIVMHGLAGSSSSNYVLGLQQSISDLGWRSVALNFRGCSGEQNLKARAYHSGDSGDIEFIYQSLKAREPKTDIYVIGFSLSGNVLLKWLGEQGEKSTVKGAIAISVPMLLNVCATKLDKGFSKVYRSYLLRPLKQFVLQKQDFLNSIKQHKEADIIKQLGSLKNVKSFWQYDNQVVAAIHGFKSADDYYTQSSARQYIKGITVPTLIIHSVDDPFMTQKVLPLKNELPKAVTLEKTSGGGHVGFVSGSNPFKPKYWLEQRIPSFLSSITEQTKSRL